jgi:hypothetical protein
VWPAVGDTGGMIVLTKSRKYHSIGAMLGPTLGRNSTILHMKKTYLQRTVMLAVLAIAFQGFGQTPNPPGTIAKLAFSLTITDEAPGTVAKDPATGKPLKKDDEGSGPVFDNEYDAFKGKNKVARMEEYVGKSVKRKYSTKEFLLDLVKIGVIEDIKGWSLVLVTDTLYDEETIAVDETPEPTEEEPDPETVLTEYPAGKSVDYGNWGYFLVNKSKPDPINVTDNFYAYVWYDDGVYLSENYTSSTPYSSEGKITATEAAMTNWSWSYTYRADAYLNIDLNKNYPANGENPANNVEEVIYLRGGIGTGGAKSGLMKDKTTSVYINGAEKASNLVGGYYYEASSGGQIIYSFVEGGFSISAGVVQPDVQKFYPEID